MGVQVTAPKYPPGFRVRGPKAGQWCATSVDLRGETIVNVKDSEREALATAWRLFKAHEPEWYAAMQAAGLLDHAEGHS